MEEDFVGNAGLDQGPVEVDESGDNLLPGLKAGENPGRRVLDKMESVQSFAGNTEQDSIMEVQAGGVSLLRGRRVADGVRR